MTPEASEKALKLEAAPSSKLPSLQQVLLEMENLQQGGEMSKLIRA